jgi:predicted dehydrogenase
MSVRSQTQKVYLIGAGVIAGHHLQGIQAIRESLEWELHVYDVHPAALDKFRTEFPSVQVHSDCAEMLAQKADPTDIVIVCTPPIFHASMTGLALTSGRHVLCEKPLFISSSEADEVERQLANSNGLLLACCSNRFVGVPPVSGAKNLIAAGRIGAPYRVRWISRGNRGRTGIEYQPTSRWFLNRAQNGGGVVMDWGPYDFATLDAIFRPTRVTVVTCFTGRVATGTRLEPGTVFDVETQAIAQMNYELPDGSIVRVDYERASATHGAEESVFEVEGSWGALNLRWVNNTKLRLSHDRDGALLSEEIPLQSDTVSIHHRPVLEMLNAVRGKPSLAIVNEDALFNFRCLRALYDSHESGRPVTIERRPLEGGAR